MITPGLKSTKLEAVNNTHLSAYFNYRLNHLKFQQEKQHLQIDSTQPNARYFSENLSEKYSSEAFQYEQVEGEAENLLARLVSWLLDRVGDLFGFEVDPSTYELVQFVVYGIFIILALYFIVRILTGQRATSLFSKKGAQIAPLTFSEKNIETVDLNGYIQEALRQNDYRLAIRYMYLRALKHLSECNIIEWDPDKTNSDYTHEIQQANVRQEFQKISYLYEYVWYGEFPMENEGFGRAKTHFDNLSKQLEDVR